MKQAVTAIFRTADVADTVRHEIIRSGVSEGHIHVFGGAQHASDIDTLNLPDDEATTYQQALREGYHVVSAEVDDDHVHKVAEIMRNPEAGVDIDAYETDYRAGPDYAAAATAAAAGTTAGAAGATSGAASGAAHVEEAAIPVGEERLTVGKRVTEGGSAHVRTYVQEVPVEERIRLRREELSVHREPADRVVTGDEADALFQDRDIEVTTKAEEAVIGKETVVTGEVVIDKNVVEEEEVVRDTVRKTEVDIDKNNV